MVTDVDALLRADAPFARGGQSTLSVSANGPGGLLFTMIDELNKYAPREGSAPMKELVLDIAERGRSLGIILIGAQQTASEGDRATHAKSRFLRARYSSCTSETSTVATRSTTEIAAA